MESSTAKKFSIIILFFLAGCQSFRGDVSKGIEPLPDENRFHSRLIKFHNVLGSNDISSWYEMASPSFRKQVSFDAFKKDLRWDERAGKGSVSQIQIEDARICSCSQASDLRCVILVNLSISTANRSPSNESLLETWDYEQREWYWSYMGPSMNGRCPGGR